MSNQPPGGFVAVDLGPGFGERFGPVWVDRNDHRMGFHVTERHSNPVGGCHGGAMATFADTQLLAFRPSSESRATHCPTISLSVDYLAPAPTGAWVEAAIIIVKQTRTMLFTQAIMTVDGEPVARSSAIYRIREKRSTT